MIYITIDTDWATDKQIKGVANILTKHRIPAIWFITHNSKAIQGIFRNKLFRIGIHPNFMSNSTQGKTVKEVINYFKKFMPNIELCRMHCLYQSTFLLKELTKKGVKYDFSLLLFDTADLTISFLPLREGIMHRIPYYWEDYIAITLVNGFSPRYYKQGKGFRIFNFHPKHIIQNHAVHDFFVDLIKHMKNNPKEILDMGELLE